MKKMTKVFSRIRSSQDGTQCRRGFTLAVASVDLDETRPPCVRHGALTRISDKILS
jgi:hypothetical protein